MYINTQYRTRNSSLRPVVWIERGGGSARARESLFGTILHNGRSKIQDMHTYTNTHTHTHTHTHSHTQSHTQGGSRTPCPFLPEDETRFYDSLVVMIRLFLSLTPQFPSFRILYCGVIATWERILQGTRPIEHIQQRTHAPQPRKCGVGAREVERTQILQGNTF